MRKILNAPWGVTTNDMEYEFGLDSVDSEISRHLAASWIKTS
jgi:hypothetical protein